MTAFIGLKGKRKRVEKNGWRVSLRREKRAWGKA